MGLRANIYQDTVTDNGKLNITNMVLLLGATWAVRNVPKEAYSPKPVNVQLVNQASHQMPVWECTACNNPQESHEMKSSG
eukprot:jgi/Chrzof1/8840/Cz03g26060.t1